MDNTIKFNSNITTSFIQPICHRGHIEILRLLIEHFILQMNNVIVEIVYYFIV